MNANRRRILLAALGWCGTLLWASQPQHAAAARDTVSSRLARLLGSSRSAREIGRVYLRERPEEAHPDRLMNLLAGDTAQFRPVSTPRELRQVFATKQRDDFQHGRTVMVRGWVLSLTEARLCALAALA